MSSVLQFPLSRRQVEDLKDTLHLRLVWRGREAEGGCRLWTGYRDRRGRGVVKVRGRHFLASRVFAWLYLGGFDLWDVSVKVKHLPGCTIPGCISEDHLRVARAAAARAA